MSIMNRITDCGAWQAGSLASALLGVGIAGFAAGGEPAARLLPPQAATVAPTVQRASAEDLIPLDPPTPAPKLRDRDPDFKFPPPYSGQRGTDLFDFSGFWKRQANSADANGKDVKNSAPIDTEAEELALGKRMLHRDQGVAVAQPTEQEAIAAAMPMVVRTDAPAWRWYGYGAPVPGANPYAPTGVYAPVQPSYYFQTGATPGAIPRPLMPLMPMAPQTPQMPRIEPEPTLPVLPPPATVEPPRLMSLPADQPSTTQEQRSETNVRPASLELPVPAAAPVSRVSWKPLSMRTTSPIVRAQAPEQDVSAEIVAALRVACVGYATQIELWANGPTSLRLRFKLTSGGLADRLADRIAHLPELAGYEIEMEFVR